jgi:asparagine synthase (glutamine-hydrolysing)
MQARLPAPLRTVARAGLRVHPRLRRVDRLGQLDAASRFVAMKAHRARTDGPALEVVRSRLQAPMPDPLAATLYLDAQLGLVDDMLHYFDRMSMAHSLEVRVPLLDHKLVELCARIPSALKVRRLTSKYLLKRVARGLIPDRIIDKPKIGFFNDALPKWTQNALRGPLPEYLLAPDARCHEFVPRREIEDLLAEGDNGGRGRADFLLALLMLEVWLSEFVPRATRAPSESPATPARA